LSHQPPEVVGFRQALYVAQTGITLMGRAPSRTSFMPL
jgi:hypothetical protein